MLTERQVRLALFCAGEELRARRAGKHPGLQQWNHELVQALTALKNELALSHSRQNPPVDSQDSDHDRTPEIGTAETARILGWNRRRVQRRADELGARHVAGRYLFDANHIHELAEEQHADGRHCA